MHGIKLRSFTHDDIPQARALMRLGYEFVAREEGFTSEQIEAAMAGRHSEEAWQEYIDTHTHLGAWLGEELAALGVLRGNEGRFLYVHPRSHGQGLGRTLLEWAEETIRAAGHTCVCITAWPSGAPYYERFGYRIVENCCVQEGPMAGRMYVRMEKGLG